ncbi:MAG: Tetracycline resistance protein, class C [Chlamydiae bacterium]|nr:Tetracycline resistance protein, class C [Chlamydiota bacterium]
MERTNKKSFLSILFVVAMDNFGFGIVFVMFAPLLLTPEYSFLPADTSIATRNLYLGILFAVFPLTQFLGAPLIGDFADIQGRKKALYITILGSVVSFLFSGLALLFSSLWGLIVSRLLAGFFAGNLSISLSAIADLSPTEKKRSHNFAIITVVMSLSWTFAMLSGGYLSNPAASKWLNPALPLWLTAFLMLLSYFAVIKYYVETHQPVQGARFDLTKGLHNIIQAFKMPKVRPFFFIILAWTIGWGLSVQWFATYSILQFKATQIGIAWGLLIQGFFWLTGGLVINRLLLKRFTSLPIAVIAFGFCALFLLLCSLPSFYWSFAFIYWLSALFASFSFSNSLNLVSINAPEGVQGKIMGLSQSMMSLGWIFVPILGGYIGAKHVDWLYPTSALFLFFGFLILAVKYWKK